MALCLQRLRPAPAAEHRRGPVATHSLWLLGPWGPARRIVCGPLIEPALFASCKSKSKRRSTSRYKLDFPLASASKRLLALTSWGRGALRREADPARREPKLGLTRTPHGEASQSLSKDAAGVTRKNKTACCRQPLFFATAS